MTVAIAGLTIALALHLFKWVIELFSGQVKERNKQSDQTRADVVRLEYGLRRIEDKVQTSLLQNERLEHDLEKILKAIEHLAGSAWPEIAKKVKESSLRGTK